MANSDSQVEVRLAALELRLAEQEAEISRLRQALRRRWWTGRLMALAGVLALLAGSLGWIMPALAQSGKEGGVEVAGTGSALLLGQANSPTTVSDTTSINDPNAATLMSRTLRIANYSDSSVENNYNLGSFRTAILGFTSGSDTSSGSPARVGVMGLVDQNGYGIYGASPNGIGGAFAGGAAQLRLVPGATAGPPPGSAHQMGELYLDSQGDLYLCTLGGANPRWTKLNLMPSYLPYVGR
jgi:uncharacterized coiled-coil protein SlyX